MVVRIAGELRLAAGKSLRPHVRSGALVIKQPVSAYRRSFVNPRGEFGPHRNFPASRFTPGWRPRCQYSMPDHDDSLPLAFCQSLVKSIARKNSTLEYPRLHREDC